MKFVRKILCVVTLSYSLTLLAQNCTPCTTTSETNGDMQTVDCPDTANNCATSTCSLSRTDSQGTCVGNGSNTCSDTTIYYNKYSGRCETFVKDKKTHALGCTCKLNKDPDSTHAAGNTQRCSDGSGT